VHKTLAVKIENESRELELKSDVMWKDARVELDGSTVVDINRDISGREVAGKQSVSKPSSVSADSQYTVKVAAGIDLALATALAICFDELAEDKEDEKDE
jgi:uncharacterized protein YxjI